MSSHWVEFERVLYARNTSHYDLELMKDLVNACHTLWNRYLPIWDQLYMLNVISYGELQRQYRTTRDD